MAEVFPKDVLLRVGGRTLARYGVPVVAGARRGPVEVPYTFARADASTCATYVDRDGIIRKAAANVLRVEWVDLDGDGIRETPGLLLEGSRANICQRSEELNDVFHSTVNASISANTDVAPDGTTSADRIIEDATASVTHGLGSSHTITADASVTISVFAKAGTRTWCKINFRDSTSARQFGKYFNLATGVVGSSTSIGGATVTASGVIALGNGWYRCWVTGTLGGGFTSTVLALRLATADNGETYSGDGVSYIPMWGVQIENSATFPSSYVKTISATVTRAADSFTLPFNFGPVDLTILSRTARPAHADASGDIGGVPGICGIGIGGNPHLRHVFVQASRSLEGTISTASVSAFSSTALIAGSQIVGCVQYRNLTTGGRAKTDAGAGFGSEAGPATAFNAFVAQTLRVGGYSDATSNPLFGVLVDLLIARGLFSRVELEAVP